MLSHLTARYRAFLIILLVYFIYDIYTKKLSLDTSILNAADSEPSVLVSFAQVMEGQPVQLAQDDPRIIQYIWKHGLLEPPSEDEYHLTGKEVDPSRGQGQFVRKILGEMRNGFFVEAGALDGETRSNTLYLEQKLGWKGLLVEGDPKNYAEVKKKNRKAWISNTCLAIKPHPHTAVYLQNFNVGKILDGTPHPKFQKPTAVVQCVPLFTLLAAINVTTIDYFCLDVEGSELKVLKTIPFDRVNIKVLSVEFEHTAEGKNDILKYMQHKGYRLVGHIGPPKYSWANDVILVHRTVNWKVTN